MQERTVSPGVSVAEVTKAISKYFRRVAWGRCNSYRAGEVEEHGDVSVTAGGANLFSQPVNRPLRKRRHDFTSTQPGIDYSTSIQASQIMASAMNEGAP